MVVGIIGFLRIPIQGYPNINPPVVTVTTTEAGVSPSIIESQITSPIENDLVGMSGLEFMSSYSQQGKSRISLHYRLGVDINAAVNDIRDRLAKISKQLPNNADQPIIEKRDPDSLQTMVLALTNPKMSTMALTDYANRYLIPQIEQLLGVATVEMYNQRDYAMKILLNPIKMAANSVTVNDLTSILQQQNVNVPSGRIKSPERDYSVLTQEQLSSAVAFRHLIIRQENGYFLRFGDVARVRVGPENTDSAMRVNGKPAIGIGVYAEATANPIQVANEIQHTLTKLQRSLPQGMKIQVVWNETNFLQASLHTVYHDLLFAIVLVSLIVFLFLGSFRSAIIPIVTIQICLIGVCGLIYFLNYSINIFTLLAFVLAIGLVVDDAIVMLENIYRHVESGLSSFKAAIKGSTEIAFAILAMTLTLAAVYSPIGFATGMTGIIFREFAFTLALAVILSGFVALTLSPMMCARLLKLPKPHNKSVSDTIRLDYFFARLTNGYRQLLFRILNFRWLIVLILIVIAVSGYWCFRSIPTELSPKEDMGAFITTINPPPNASFAYINRYAQQVEKLLRSLPSVKKVLMIADPDRGGFAYVILKPWSQRKDSAQQLIHTVIKKSRNIPGVSIDAFNVSQIGGGGRYGDSVRMVISSDQTYQQLHNTVQHFLMAIHSYPGIANSKQDLQMDNQQYVIYIRRSLAAALGVNVADVTNTLRTMLGGVRVTSFNWESRDYDVVLQVPEKELQSLQIINQMYVRSQDNKMIPLSSLARISTMVGPQELPHENRLRSDTITMQVTPGYTLGQVVNYLQHAAKHVLAEDYQYRFKGEAKRMLESTQTMIGTFSLALLFIYLVLSAQFESFIDPLIILFSVPLSIVGALFTLKLTGNSLSIYTNIGFVTLVGLIAKHGILITEFANQQRQQGKALQDSLVDAAALRLRPILMTTAAMVIGAIPLACAHGAGALGRHHIGWVIVGGLLVGTFFSLIVVPITYSYLGRFRKIK